MHHLNDIKVGQSQNLKDTLGHYKPVSQAVTQVYQSNPACRDTIHLYASSSACTLNKGYKESLKSPTLYNAGRLYHLPCRTYVQTMSCVPPEH